MILTLLFVMAQVALATPVEHEFTADDYRLANLRGAMVEEVVREQPTEAASLGRYFFPAAMIELDGHNFEVPNIQPFYEKLRGCTLVKRINGLLPSMPVQGRLVRDAQAIEVYFDCQGTARNFNFVVLEGRILSIDDNKLDG